jgi:hypothetical protein
MRTNQRKMRTVTILMKKKLIKALYINLHPISLKKKTMNNSRTSKNKKRKKCLLLLKMKKIKMSKSLSLMRSK